MLKKLIALFAEKFLTNKKEWIGNQALPSKICQSQTITNTQQNIIAPFDGYALLRLSSGGGATDNTWLRLENHTRQISCLSNATATWKWVWIPVCMGDEVITSLGESAATADFIFIKSNGSS